MSRFRVARHASTWVVAAVVSAGVWVVPGGGSTGAATPQGTVSGEGGDAIGPIMVKLLHDDAAGLAPDFGSYTNVDLDQGIAAFVGSAPGTFGSDFAVSERKLTAAETASATANGRSFAYVPFVGSPVALMTLAPDSTFSGLTITPSDYCQHIPLSLAQLDGIYGAPAYTSWGDSNLSCTSSASTPPQPIPFQLWGNLDPTMENDALMSLLDSTTASTNAFQAGLTTAQSHGLASTSDPTPSEQWPYSNAAYPGGDQTTLTKIIGLDETTNAPSTNTSNITLGAIMPIASDWTGNPLGVPWNLPTAAVENGAGVAVPPSAASAKAAQGDATLAATSDPTTNNLVTFDVTSTDANAYNAYLMMESYLVVPLNGLPADKALALAQFIRFVVGGAGQADITALGAAPATAAMAKADLVVAQQLDAEAAADPAAAASTTTTTATSASTSNGSASSQGTTGNTGTAAAAPTTDASTSGGLAATGSNPIPLAGLGLALLVCGETARRIVRRRKASA
jgi:hypothetical protein